MDSVSWQVQEGLVLIRRKSTGVELWLAVHRGHTYMSYSEVAARLWLFRAKDGDQAR